MENPTEFNTPVVDNIVGRQPIWIVRSGITLIFTILTMLLALTWFIQYPDSIHSQVTLTSQQTPVQLVAKSDSRITRIFVKEGEFVEEKTPLVLLENSIEYEQFLKLNTLLIPKKFQSLNALNIDGLGELQPFVNQVHKALNELSLYQKPIQLNEKTQNTQSLTEEYKKLQHQYDLKMKTMQSKMKIEASLLADKKKLMSKGLVTAVEMAEMENRYLDKEMALEDIKIQRETYTIRIKELNQSLSDYKIEREERIQSLKTQLSNNYLELKSQIAQWQQRYLLVAPASGIISFSDYWSVNQQVKRSDVVVSIVDKSAIKIGKMQLNQQGAGKVALGQRVSIELASFPSIEFGRVEGSIETISLMPGQRGYMVEIKLSDTLITTYGKVLPFVPNSIGNAKIITQEKRLIERFLDKIFYALDTA